MKLDQHKDKITLMGFVALLALMLGLIAEVFFQFQSMNQKAQVLVKDTHAKLTHAFSMRDAIQSRANGLKTMLLQPDPFLRDEEYLRFQEYAGQYRQARERIMRLNLSPLERQLHESLRKHTREAMPLNEHVNELLRAETDAKTLTLAVDQAIQAQNSLLMILDRFIVLEKQEVARAVAGSEAAYQRSLQNILTVSGLILLLGIAVATWVVRQANGYHRELSYQANHDALTGLLNRPAFERRLSFALADYRNKGQEYGLLYMDLDFFKQVNDTCGHPAGDKLLQELTVEIQDCLDKEDAFGRMGGDEFTVLLDNCSREQVLKVANRILASVAAFDFAWEGEHFPIGVSIGVACIEKYTDSISCLLNLADKACYAAKAKGRNCIQIANAELLRQP